MIVQYLSRETWLLEDFKIVIDELADGSFSVGEIEKLVNNPEDVSFFIFPVFLIDRPVGGDIARNMRRLAGFVV